MLVRLNVIKKAFQRGDVDLSHIGNKSMVADIFTKALPYEDLCRLREVLLGHASIIFNWDPNNYCWQVFFRIRGYAIYTIYKAILVKVSEIY